MAEETKKAGPLKALFLLIAAGVLYLVQQVTGLDLFSKGQDETAAGGGSAVEAPADTTPAPKPSPQPEANKPAPKPQPKPEANKPAPPKPQPKVQDDGGAAEIAALFKAGTSDAWVEVEGTVVHLLKDDLYGSKHQLFLLELENDITLKISHNIDLAPRVPVQKGDTVRLKGEYEWNDKGGVVHWTHHNPAPNPIKPGGWIEHKGKLYK